MAAGMVPEGYQEAVDAKMKLIVEHPELHTHDFFGLQRCCVVMGILDARLMEAHEAISTRTNGGQRCDVTSGPCSCGAWH